jgi:hypothetical protein
MSASVVSIDRIPMKSYFCPAAIARPSAQNLQVTSRFQTKVNIRTMVGIKGRHPLEIPLERIT